MFSGRASVTRPPYVSSGTACTPGPRLCMVLLGSSLVAPRELRLEPDGVGRNGYDTQLRPVNRDAERAMHWVVKVGVVDIAGQRLKLDPHRRRAAAFRDEGAALPVLHLPCEGNSVSHIVRREPAHHALDDLPALRIVDARGGRIHFQ